MRAALLIAVLAACAAGPKVTITRDDWGIAHVRGKTDADAVFGMIYAQAEDDFPRVEQNYLVALGRLAEADGEKALWQDLRQRLYHSEASLRADYAASPPWLRRLMDAWAAGLNAYLAAHRETRPRVLTRFEPWMALSFTEGSIGGDIERISLDDLEAFYGGAAPRAAVAPPETDPWGSNGIAIAPANTALGRALLLINPHTSFFFRSELHMTSDEGLDVYGAVTWGQLFVYQGFNARAAWMHTSSGVDAVDEFLETLVRRDGKIFYRYGEEQRPLRESKVTLAYRTADGGRATRDFTVYHTHRGPIVRAEGERWVSFAMMHRPVAALSQSFLRTKARTFAEYQKALELRANSSNNTVYADADGTIAYLHPQFVPRREDRFDYRRPVDGADAASDWRGEHALAELPAVVNPPGGWIQNTNNGPFSAAGDASPARERFPGYMDVARENARGQHAIAVISGRKDFTVESRYAAAVDPAMPALDRLIPARVAAWDRAPRAKLAEPIAALRGWDRRWAVDSVPTTLAVLWGEELLGRCGAEAIADPEMPTLKCLPGAPGEAQLAALEAVVDRLQRDFGQWRVPWGDINRFQRISADITASFDDTKPSIAVAFTPGIWGSLASFGVKPNLPTKKRYGSSGNSFVAVVELGPDGPRAVAVTAGGESGDPRSPHFDDQAERYATGQLRPVYFRPRDLQGHTERTYEPR